MTSTIAPPPRETRQSERLYAKIAPRYESIFERAILAEGRLIELVGETMNGRRVLDLACGNGRWLDRFRPASYLGLDLNEALLGEAKSRYPYADFLRADMTRIPLADDSCDGVMSMFGAMGHLPPDGQEVMVREVWRVLAPGGMAIFTNGNLCSPFALPTTISGGRVRIEGVPVRVHSATPSGFRFLLRPFEVLQLESYDYSYVPILPLKFAASLIGRDYRPVYAHWMDLFDHCRYIPTLQWFGKQLLAVCRKR